MEHSPQRPFFGPGSPPRTFSNGPTDAQLPPPFQRPMLPPSPQHFQSRYSQAPPPPPPPLAQGFVPQNEPRSLPPAPKRPGSSMSISSMLGSDADKPAREPLQNIPPRGHSHHSSTSAPSMSLGAVMSPPQHTSRPANGDYVYKPRSQTPDRAIFATGLGGVRPHRSSSGTMMQRPGPFEGQTERPAQQTHTPQHGAFSPPAPAPPLHADDAAERVRRTSINGILQRPNSQPQHTSQPRASTVQPSNFQSAWGHPAMASTDRVEPSQPNPYPGASRGHSFGEGVVNGPARQNGVPGTYDTRPPAFGQQRPTSYSMSERETGGQNHVDRGFAPPASPESKRSIVDAASNRGLANILNGNVAPTGPFRPENGQHDTQPMARQDSTQSQSERSAFGDRLDRGRPRFFSPFAGAANQHPGSSTSAPPEDQGRKGSDESSHHRAILGLTAEAKRGRFSPLPQAVQGAQAQTPVPDAGIKSEHGRVFSGIGSGIPTISSIHGSAPPGLSASPFKRDEGLPRLSEDNLMKISRSTPGTTKRPRKTRDNTGRAESDIGEAQTLADLGPSAKRGKHHHHHIHIPVDSAEDLNSSLKIGQRSTPFSSLAAIRGTSTPTANANLSHTHHHHHQHHHHRQPRGLGPTNQLISKPKRTIHIGHFIQTVAHNPRNHLGSFLYEPSVTALGASDANPFSRLKLSIRPPNMPPFDGPEYMNCTYTIRVGRRWLAHDTREAIRAQRFLWGSGVYSDDSDPLCAAMHAGFIKAAFGDQVDTTLLDLSRGSQVMIEGGQDNVPDEPMEVPAGMDLHLTLLVVPGLERYVSTTRFGVVSRQWGRDGGVHDGVSFVVLGAKFVDEGVGRARGRTGAERKRAIRARLKEGERVGRRLRELMREKEQLERKAKKQGVRM